MLLVSDSTRYFHFHNKQQNIIMNTSSSSSSSGNMIQNKSKPLHPSNHSTQIIKDEDVSEQNLRDLLTSQSRSAAFQCPMVNKKQLLEPIFNNHKVIINTVTNIDNDNSDTSILTHLKNELLYSSSESTSTSKLWKDSTMHNLQPR